MIDDVSLSGSQFVYVLGPFILIAYCTNPIEYIKYLFMHSNDTKQKWNYF